MEYEDQPRISTVRFIEKLAAQGVHSISCPLDVTVTYPVGSEGVFSWVVTQVIPGLIGVALDEATSERVRAPAIKASRKLWKNGLWIHIHLQPRLSIDLLTSSSRLPLHKGRNPPLSVRAA